MTSPMHTLEQHLLAALDPAPAETRRLFHGRGRCWEGLEQVTVDWLQGVLSVALFREPPEGQLAELEAMLRNLAERPQWTGQAILIQHRYLPVSSARWSRMA